MDDSSHFAVGFIEGDIAYLFSLDYVHEGLVAYDLKKDAGDKKTQESFSYTGIFDIDIYNTELAYDDGWIYYNPFDSPQLHKIRCDGTNDQLVYEGIIAYEINCSVDHIMLAGPENEEDEQEKTLLICKDGEFSKEMK